MTSGWSGWLRLRCSATRKQVSCECDNNGGECGGGSGSGDTASAGVLRSGGPSGWGANSVRCSADGDVCAGYAAGSVDGFGVVLGVCAEEWDEGRDADDRGSGGCAEPGAYASRGYGTAGV